MGNELLTGMSDWRQQHPTATLREIEEVMDERLARWRAEILEELVKMSPHADWSQSPAEDRCIGYLDHPFEKETPGLSPPASFSWSGSTQVSIQERNHSGLPEKTPG